MIEWLRRVEGGVAEWLHIIQIVERGKTFATSRPRSLLLSALMLLFLPVKELPTNLTAGCNKDINALSLRSITLSCRIKSWPDDEDRRNSNCSNPTCRQMSRFL